MLVFFLKFELGLGKNRFEKILKCLILKWKIHNAFLFFEFLTGVETGHGV